MCVCWTQGLQPRRWREKANTSVSCDQLAATCNSDRMVRLYLSHLDDERGYDNHKTSRPSVTVPLRSLRTTACLFQ
ncbi:hypothetical protein J6590_019433 [Homalodisca vitripennis]|nr:hypothetical protein J6590_019433 [Homalodisca vitripennis]